MIVHSHEKSEGHHLERNLEEAKENHGEERRVPRGSIVLDISLNE